MKNLYNRFKVAAPAATAGVALASPAFAEITVDYAGITTGLTTQITTALTAALPVLGAIMGIMLGIKLYKRFAGK